MVLAQQTPLVLLDEPTTYLDIAHQVELLDLFAMLNREQGRTVVAVLHDLNHACRYADQIIAMKAGAIVAQGNPNDVITEELVEAVYGLECQIIDDPADRHAAGGAAGVRCRPRAHRAPGARQRALTGAMRRLRRHDEDPPVRTGGSRRKVRVRRWPGRLPADC